MGTWRTLHPRRILHALGVISVHGGVSPDVPRTRALRSSAECSANSATTVSRTSEVAIAVLVMS